MADKINMDNKINTESRLDRAYGTLVGGAIGDAMGMPASFFTRDQIKKTYGYIGDFLEPEAKTQSWHGNLSAGEVTDDTMESLIIAKILMEQGEFSKTAFNLAMKDWCIKGNMLESTVIGPSTRRYLTALVEGKDPEEGAKESTTNGSAMRVAPIGIKYWNDFDACLMAAAASSLPSHGSRPCVAGACAVASAVAAGVRGGYTPEEIMYLAYEGALYGEQVGHDVTAPLVSKRILLAKALVENYMEEGISSVIDELVGTLGASMYVYESVPLCLGVFYAVQGIGADGIPAAVNCGDDADTNGSICGNLCGAFSGASAFPEGWKSRVEKSSNLDFLPIAKQLI